MQTEGEKIEEAQWIQSIMDEAHRKHKEKEENNKRIVEELEEEKKTIATLEKRIEVLESQVAWYRKPAQKEIDEHRNIATHRKEWLETNIGIIKHVDGFQKTKQEDQTSVNQGHHGGAIMAINDIGQWVTYPVDSSGNRCKSWNT